jgi:hypothetical protein
VLGYNDNFAFNESSYVLCLVRNVLCCQSKKKNNLSFSEEPKVSLSITVYMGADKIHGR